jgi:hypothetical protein
MNGVCVHLAVGTRWFRVSTPAQAAALTVCKPGEIERFEYMTEQAYVRRRA